MPLFNQTKQEFCNALSKYYESDKITTDLIFTGNRLNSTGWALLKTMPTEDLEIHKLTFKEFTIHCKPSVYDTNSAVQYFKKTYPQYSTMSYNKIDNLIDKVIDDYAREYVDPIAIDKLEKYIADTNGFYYYDPNNWGFSFVVWSSNNIGFTLCETANDIVDFIGIKEKELRDMFPTYQELLKRHFDNQDTLKE